MLSKAISYKFYLYDMISTYFECSEMNLPFYHTTTWTHHPSSTRLICLIQTRDTSGGALPTNDKLSFIKLRNYHHAGERTSWNLDQI